MGNLNLHSSLLHSLMNFFLVSFPISSMLSRNSLVTSFAAFPVARLKDELFESLN